MVLWCSYSSCWLLLQPLLATTCIPVMSPSPGTAPSPPQPCHHQHVPFAFDIILHINYPQQAVAIALHILQHFFYILSSPSTPQHWDAQPGQDHLNNLQHYIHHLEQCMPANGMLFEGQEPHNLPFGINKYFRLIQDFICTHNSSCLWDHVQLKACICFEHVDTHVADEESTSFCPPPNTPASNAHLQPTSAATD
uniref:Interferon alpha n=1 Tax=Malurus cyaneus samueli TaxID=2593467 RepID=A0A8C5U1F5_9PASS